MDACSENTCGIVYRSAAGLTPEILRKLFLDGRIAVPPRLTGKFIPTVVKATELVSRWFFPSRICRRTHCGRSDNFTYFVVVAFIISAKKDVARLRSGHTKEFLGGYLSVFLADRDVYERFESVCHDCSTDVLGKY